MNDDVPCFTESWEDSGMKDQKSIHCHGKVRFLMLILLVMSAPYLAMKSGKWQENLLQDLL